MCGVTTRYLAVQVGRGKVVVGDDDMIDGDNDVNRAYLVKMKAKNNVSDDLPESAPPLGARGRKKAAVEGGSEPAAAEAVSDEDEKRLREILKNPKLKGMDRADIETAIKWHQLEKLKKENEIKDIEIAKKRGEVIPSGLVPPVFVQHNQSFLTCFKNVAEQIVTDFGQIKKLSPAEISTMRGRMYAAINDGMKKSEETTTMAIKNIVREYVEKRGVGERG